MAEFLPKLDPFENFRASVTVDEKGFADIDVTYYAQTLGEAMELIQYGKACPLATGPSPVVASALFKYGSFNMEEGGAYKVVLHWKGISIDINLNDTIYPNYAPVGNTQPIDTHEKFLLFAGTRDNKNPMSNPEFDNEGKFIKFARRLEDGDGNPMTGQSNPWAGIESYYLPGLSVKDERVMKSQDIQQADLFNVGKIDDPDVAELPKLHTSVYGLDPKLRNYLLMSLEIEDFANDYIGVSREWQMSGPWGWDTDIYQFSDPEINWEIP